MKKIGTRGFITIATGDDWYYKIALNLLISYRYCTKNPLPFAILADRENEITKEFDKVIILDNASGSYIDKLRLGDYLPFDETIFIDADCLAYDDLNDLFQVFNEADDFSCLGGTAPLTEEFSGWFSLLTFPEVTNQNSGVINRETAKRIFDHTIGLHGGMYYIKNTKTTHKVFHDALKCVEKYMYYNFHIFDKPADEPVLALAMAMNNCKPINFDNYALFCFWRYPNMKLLLSKKKAYYKEKKVSLVHWGTVATKTAIYKKQVDQLYLSIKGESKFKVFFVNVLNTANCWIYYLKQFMYRVIRRVIK